MLDETDVIEAVSFDLLGKGFAILRKSRKDRNDVDIVASWPETGAKLLISAAGVSRSRAGRAKLEAAYTEAQVFYSVSRAILSALRMKGELKFEPGDHLALALPDTLRFREQLSVQKSVLDSFGIKVFLVTEDKKVETF